MIEMKNTKKLTKLEKYAEIDQVALSEEVQSLVYERVEEDYSFSIPSVKYQGYFYEDGEELEDESVTSESLIALVTYITEKGFPITKINKVR